MFSLVPGIWQEQRQASLHNANIEEQRIQLIRKLNLSYLKFIFSHKSWLERLKNYFGFQHAAMSQLVTFSKFYF